MRKSVKIAAVAALTGALAATPALAQISSQRTGATRNSGITGDSAYDNLMGRLGSQQTRNQPLQIVRFPNNNSATGTNGRARTIRANCNRNLPFSNPIPCR